MNVYEDMNNSEILEKGKDFTIETLNAYKFKYIRTDSSGIFGE